jgi:hypothetical protein
MASAALYILRPHPLSRITFTLSTTAATNTIMPRERRDAHKDNTDSDSIPLTGFGKNLSTRKKQVIQRIQKHFIDEITNNQEEYTQEELKDRVIKELQRASVRYPLDL